MCGSEITRSVQVPKQMQPRWTAFKLMLHQQLNVWEWNRKISLSAEEYAALADDLFQRLNPVPEADAVLANTF